VSLVETHQPARRLRHDETAFLELWKEFAKAVLRGYCCRLCREQLDIVRDPQEFNWPMKTN
jgi:hypothetical protein